MKNKRSASFKYIHEMEELESFRLLEKSLASLLP